MTGPSPGPVPPRIRLAYLNTRYPALSHTFIQREIEALRDDGVDVVPVSIRRPTVAELGRGADVAEMSRTVYLLDRPRRVAWGLATALLRRPLRFLRALAASQALSPGGLRARARHLAYALEAVLLARELRLRTLDHVHVHMANNGAMVALLATKFDDALTYSLTIHGSAEFFDIERLRVREKAEGASFVRFISESGRAQIMAFTDASAWTKFHVVHCGVDVAAFSGRPRPVCGPLHVLAIGRLTPIKGYRVLLGALQSLAAQGLTWDLRMAGDGPERASLEALAARLGIRDRVEFLGPLAPAGIRDELQRAGVLVVSSFMEGIPVVLMEAMAAGVPVISTRVGGVSELVEDGITGRLVSPGSETALASALGEVWEDSAAAERRTTAARARIQDGFEIRSSARQMRALFHKYAGRSTRAS